MFTQQIKLLGSYLALLQILIYLKRHKQISIWYVENIIYYCHHCCSSSSSLSFWDFQVITHCLASLHMYENSLVTWAREEKRFWDEKNKINWKYELDLVMVWRHWQNFVWLSFSLYIINVWAKQFLVLSWNFCELNTAGASNLVPFIFNSKKHPLEAPEHLQQSDAEHCQIVMAQVSR